MIKLIIFFTLSLTFPKVFLAKLAKESDECLNKILGILLKKEKRLFEFEFS